MNSIKNKYSLWIVPTGENTESLRQLVRTIFEERDTPDFDPHVTLVANIFADEDELVQLRKKIISLVENLRPFKVRLGTYGYLDEQFRALYLLAEGEELSGAYATAERYFEQVGSEHFRAMPHLSVMYDTCSPETKEQIIAAHPIQPLEFTVESIDLYRTNDPIESWQRVETFPLG